MPSPFNSLNEEDAKNMISGGNAAFNNPKVRIFLCIAILIIIIWILSSHLIKKNKKK